MLYSFESDSTDVQCRHDCFCNYQFNVKACSVQGIYKTTDVLKNDPSSLACPADQVDVMSKSRISSPCNSDLAIS